MWKICRHLTSVWKVSQEKRVQSTLTSTCWEEKPSRIKPSSKCEAAFNFLPNDAQRDFLTTSFILHSCGLGLLLVRAFPTPNRWCSCAGSQRTVGKGRVLAHKRATMEGARWVVHSKSVMPGRELLSCSDASAEKLATNKHFQHQGQSRKSVADFGFYYPPQHPSVVCPFALEAFGAWVMYLCNPCTTAPWWQLLSTPYHSSDESVFVKFTNNNEAIRREQECSDVRIS